MMASFKAKENVIKTSGKFSLGTLVPLLYNEVHGSANFVASL